MGVSSVESAAYATGVDDPTYGLRGYVSCRAAYPGASVFFTVIVEPLAPNQIYRQGMISYNWIGGTDVEYVVHGDVVTTDYNKWPPEETVTSFTLRGIESVMIAGVPVDMPSGAIHTDDNIEVGTSHFMVPLGIQTIDYDIVTESTNVAISTVTVTINGVSHSSTTMGGGGSLAVPSSALNANGTITFKTWDPKGGTCFWRGTSW